MPACTFWSTRERNHRLTGRVRFRTAKTRLGLIATGQAVAIVVEEAFDRTSYNVPPRTDADLAWEPRTRWRDANALDLAHPALRWLVDGPRRETETKEAA